jgi:hypothetical protein
LWADYCGDQVEEEEWKRLGTILGTHWTRESVAALFGQGRGRKQLEKISLPLAFVIQPGAQDMLKGMFGRPSHLDAPDGTHPEDIVEGWDMSREQFQQVAGGSAWTIPKLESMFMPKK